MKSKLQRLKVSRSASGYLDMDRILAHEVRLGLATENSVAKQPTATIYPSPYVTERLAHFGADRRIAVNSAYDAMCERNDAELASIIEGHMRRIDPCSKPPRAARVMVND